jgi:hypothetical protein
MRAARLISCLVVGISLFAQTSSLLGQRVEDIIYNVTEMGDGSVEQARLEAQRQVEGIGPRYRSYRKDERKSFSGEYVPPELPEDKKGRYVYGLAVFSDDGSNVTVEGSQIHTQLQKPQHLPNLEESFHVLPIAVGPGQPVSITVDYSNTIYHDDPRSPEYPDVDGCALFLYLIPIELAVDGNRDGEIQLGRARDRTDVKNPFRFWLNDDNDGVVNGSEVLGGLADSSDREIASKRDLEDFARLWLRIGGLHKEIAAGTIKIGLKWRGTTNPSINLYQAAEANGRTRYLERNAPATSQTSGDYRIAKTTVSGITAAVLPTSIFSNLTEQRPTTHFLFEGVSEGTGQLVVTLHTADGTEIAEGPAVWLDLMNVKEMYARASATPDTIFKPYESDSPVFDDSAFNFIAEPYTAPPDEEKNALVFVHGWNMSSERYLSFSETMFKRLWHQGFKGRFCAFRWATLTSLDSYNTSEYRAWKYGRSLINYVTNLPGDYLKNVAAHSMGNVVTGSALQRGMSLNCYFLMQAALPGSCYTSVVSNYLVFARAERRAPTPDTAADLGYGLYLEETSPNVARFINFFNVVDFALATGSYPIVGSTNWEQNQILFKPDANATLHANKVYAYDLGPPNSPYPVGQRCFLRRIYPPFEERRVLDIHESMAYVARPRSRAIGAEPNSDAVFPISIDLGAQYGFGRGLSDHSGQFERRIQQVHEFYKAIFDQLN